MNDINNNLQEDTQEDMQKDINNEISDEVDQTDPTPSDLPEDDPTQDIVSGLYSVLYRRIGDLKITDQRISRAFSMFIDKVEMRSSFSICEILNSAESIVVGGEPNEAAETIIYVADAKHFSKCVKNRKIMKHSVASFYSLFSLHNGVSLDLSFADGDMSLAESKRYFVMTEKQKNRFEKIIEGLSLVKCGMLIADNRIIINQNGRCFSTDKSVIDNKSAPCSVELNQSHYDKFLSGYRAALSQILCNCVSNDALLRFGLGGDISDCCARALGYFAARVSTRMAPHLMKLSAENNASVAVSRPVISEGDYVYYLKLRCDANGIPDKAHYLQLCFYLSEKIRLGVIKNVLPSKENIDGILSRLAGDSMVYETVNEFPKDTFGIIVTVSRGESINGMQLGYFKYN